MTLRVRPTPERPLSPRVISTVSHQARGDRRSGVADMDHERKAADRGAIDPFRRQAEIMRDRDRRLAGGRDAVNVGGFEPGIGLCVERGVGMQLDLR